MGLLFCYSIKYPDKYANVFSFCYSFITNISAISLGVLAVYQSKKYKLDSDKRELTPVIVISTPICSPKIEQVDIISTNCNIGECINLNLVVCSFNKSISNFKLDHMILKKDNTVVNKYINWNNDTGLNSKYNGIFLQDIFYTICVSCPPPCVNGKLEITYYLNNIFHSGFYKTISLISISDEWRLESATQCKIII